MEVGAVKQAVALAVGLVCGVILTSPLAEQVEVTTVEYVHVQVEEPVWEPFVPYRQEHDPEADCLWELMHHLGQPILLAELLVVADFADLHYGGPCRMLGVVREEQ
jgi:hypothetical protein